MIVLNDETGAVMNSDEIFWETLLSRQPRLIRAAYKILDAETQAAVIAHLRVMTTEEGWHPEQIKSAQTALDFIAILQDKASKKKGEA